MGSGNSPRVISLGAWCDLVDEDDIRRRAAETAPFVSPLTSPEDAGPGIAPVDVEQEIADLQHQASFVVHEFADLSDGSRITLHQDRGFGLNRGRQDPWSHLTEESLRGDVLMTVLPDEDDPADDHPYEWLADLCTAAGVPVTAEELRPLPYAVVLSERVLDRLDRAPGGPQHT